MVKEGYENNKSNQVFYQYIKYVFVDFIGCFIVKMIRNFSLEFWKIFSISNKQY